MKGKEDYETCAICLEEFENADMIRVLPCSHSKSDKFIICIDIQFYSWLVTRYKFDVIPVQVVNLIYTDISIFILSVYNSPFIHSIFKLDDFYDQHALISLMSLIQKCCSVSA